MVRCLKTTWFCPTVESKERKKRARVKRSNGAVSGFSGGRCVDHLLATLQLQEEDLKGLLAVTIGPEAASSTSSSSSTSSTSSANTTYSSTWHQLLEGLRELLRTKCLKESVESEASIYVGLPLISFAYQIVGSCVALLKARKKDAEPKPQGREIGQLKRDCCCSYFSYGQIP